MFPCQGLEERSAQCACTAWMAVKSDCTPHSWLMKLQLFVCVICAAYFSAAQGDCTNLPTCKAKADGLGLRLRNQDYLHVLYASSR